MAAVLTVAELFSVLQLAALNVKAEPLMTQEECRDVVSTYSVTDSVPGYSEYLEAHAGAARPQQEITVDAGSYSCYMENDAEVTPEIYSDYEGMTGDALLTTESAYVEYQVDVPESGLYELALEYYPVEGKNSEIQRSIFVDGVLPYGELSLVEFPRIWSTDIAQASFEDGIYDVEGARDIQGNDRKPTAIEIPEWTVANCYDNNGYITEPLSLYLEQGVHTITINSQREPMLLRRLILSNSASVQSYAEVKAAWDAQGVQPTSGQNVMIQAENATKTSSQMLYPKQDQSSPAVSPSSAKALLNNSIGGGRAGAMPDSGSSGSFPCRNPDITKSPCLINRALCVVSMYRVRSVLTALCRLQKCRITALPMHPTGAWIRWRTRRGIRINFI